jgi:hypothetical protein
MALINSHHMSFLPVTVSKFLSDMSFNLIAFDTLAPVSLLLPVADSKNFSIGGLTIVSPVLSSVGVVSVVQESCNHFLAHMTHTLSHQKLPLSSRHGIIGMLHI